MPYSGDMGGFPSPGVPAIISPRTAQAFGRPQIVYRKVNYMVATGGESQINLGGSIVDSKSIMIFKNGALVTPPYTFSGNNVVTSSATSGDVFLVDYLAKTPNAPDSTLSTGLNTDAISLWPKVVEWFELNDAVGTTITGANGLVLTKSGSPVMQSTPVRSGGGHSIHFGSGDYFRSSSAITAMRNITNVGLSVFAWFKPDTLNTANGSLLIYDWGGTSSFPSYGLSYSAAAAPHWAGAWKWNSSGSPTGAVITPSTSTIANGTGYHLGFTCSNPGLVVKNYKNGVLDNTGTADHLWTGDGANFGTDIGNISSFPTTYYAGGYLQDIVICKDVVTASEAAYLYNGGAGVSYAVFKAASGH